MSPRSPTSAALVLFVLLVPALARASPAYCVKTYFESLKRDGPTLGISASDAQRLVQRVSESIGLQSTAQVIPCPGEPKAYAWPGDGSKDVPDGQYIIYDPDWVREVIGKDQVQAVALFGHELGHFLNQDFTVRRDEERKVKERDADHFAGCAVAKVTGDFSKLEDLLSRLRLEKDTMYPDRLTSIETAKAGFESCGPVQLLSYGFRSNSFSIAATGERFEQARPLVWHEMSKDGRDPSFVFQEKAHTETEIILYDVSRNFYLRLPIPDGLAQWRVGESGPWTYWYASTYHK